MPRNAVEASELQDPLLVRCMRVFLANRGVWEAIPGAGPTVSVPATEEDVDRYVDAYAGWLEAIT
jgi:glutamate-1-semialdehyde 2,1-aminomutase